MRTTRTQEIWVGIFVALGIAAIFVLALKASNFSSFGSSETYQVKMYFDNIGGLKTRSPVTMSGVKIGQVKSIDYDREEFQALVLLEIDSRYDFLPEDTQASIYTAGLLGEQYIALEPGAEELALKDGSTIRHTQSALVLEELIGRVLVSFASKE